MAPRSKTNRGSQHAKKKDPSASTAQETDLKAASATTSDPRDVNELLRGLCTIEVDTTLLHEDFLCPQQACFVLNINRVHAPRGHPYRDHLSLVLNAAAALCVTAQQLRQRDDDEHAAFWARVLQSDVMHRPCGHAEAVRLFARHVKYFGVCLLLSWSGCLFQPIVLEPLERMLRKPLNDFTQNSESLFRSNVGLRLSNCGLRRSHIVSLVNALAVFETNVSAISWCYAEALRVLDVSGNALDAHALHALADILESQSTRQLCELRLNCIMDDCDEDFRSREYISGLGRVLHAVFTAKRLSSEADGVSLSFADNHSLLAEHIQALIGALRDATRPLKALSLAGTSVSSNASSRLLGRLLFSPLRTVNARFPTLDISRIHRLHVVIEHMLTSLGDLVLEAMPRIKAALASDRIVLCRLTRPAIYELQDTATALEVNLDPSGLFRVRSATEEGWLQIEYGSESSASAAWTLYTFASALQIDQEDIAGSSFAGIVCDETQHPGSTSLDPHWLVKLFAAVGSTLRQLSLRGYRSKNFARYIDRIIACCPNLQGLNLSVTNVVRTDSQPFWNGLTPSNFPSLRILNVSDSQLQPSSLSSLPYLGQLRHLNLSGNGIGVDGLTSLLSILRSHRELEYIQVSSATKQNATAARSVQSQILAQLRSEHLPPENKLAFIGVVRALLPQFQGFDKEILLNIFDMTGENCLRTVVWT